MSVGKPEEIDLAFNSWYNQAQPLRAIVKVKAGFSEEVLRTIRQQIKHAFVHGYARGVAAEAAQPLPDHPELGGVR